MQTVLGLPGDLLDGWWCERLTLQQIAAEPRPILVSPGGFDKDASQMSIAGLRYRELSSAPAAGVLAGDHSAVAHKLFGGREAGHLSDLDGDGDGAQLFDPSHGLQSIDDGFHPGRGMFD